MGLNSSLLCAQAGNYTLTYRFENESKQIRIQKSAAGFGLAKSKQLFGSLSALIVHYAGPRTDGNRRDLRCRLVYLPTAVIARTTRRLSFDNKDSSTDAVDVMETIPADAAIVKASTPPHDANAPSEDGMNYGNPNRRESATSTGVSSTPPTQFLGAQGQAYELADIQPPTFKPPAPPKHVLATTLDEATNVDDLTVQDAAADKFYFPKLDKLACNELLKPCSKGMFLVRDSSSSSAYVIAVKDTAKVKHYTITTSDGGYKFGGKVHKDFAKVRTASLHRYIYQARRVCWRKVLT